MQYEYISINQLGKGCEKLQPLIERLTKPIGTWQTLKARTDQLVITGPDSHQEGEIWFDLYDAGGNMIDDPIAFSPHIAEKVLTDLWAFLPAGRKIRFKSQWPATNT